MDGPYVGWLESLSMPFGVSSMFSALLELICAIKSMPYKWIIPTSLPWVCAIDAPCGNAAGVVPINSVLCPLRLRPGAGGAPVVGGETLAGPVDLPGTVDLQT